MLQRVPPGGQLTSYFKYFQPIMIKNFLFYKFPGPMVPNWDFVGKELGTCWPAPPLVGPDPPNRLPPSPSFFLAPLDLLASPQVKTGFVDSKCPI